jgi:hypothetical protein
LRLKGFADTPAVVEAVGADVSDVVARLENAQADGLVSRRDGTIKGWSLTPGGRAKHSELIANELADSGARDKVADAYRRFLAINAELLATCTDWQLRGGALNDHADRDYDAAVILRLREVNAAVQPVCQDLGGALDRFSRYGARLDEALRKVEAGQHDWFAKPMIDSYHTVWFELHEDLLVTLGIERSKEGSS